MATTAAAVAVPAVRYCQRREMEKRVQRLRLPDAQNNISDNNIRSRRSPVADRVHTAAWMDDQDNKHTHTHTHARARAHTHTHAVDTHAHTHSAHGPIAELAVTIRRHLVRRQRRLHFGRAVADVLYDVLISPVVPARLAQCADVRERECRVFAVLTTIVAKPGLLPVVHFADDRRPVPVSGQSVGWQVTHAQACKWAQL